MSQIGWSAESSYLRKSGKTEDNDRNAFVGECKIWRGAKQVDSALGQLLGYLTWRDCKAALIVFNTQVAGFSGLLEKLPETLSKHPLMLKESLKNSPLMRKSPHPPVGTAS